jgi:formamidopyrimidine-DNA glycosylase
LGINFITLYYTDINGISVPVNYRIYDKQDLKTKNDYLREMINEVMDWGLKPRWITGDSWYASLENLQLVRHHQLGFLFAIKNNRLVSLKQRGKYCQVQCLEIPEEGLVVHMKGFGQVKVFRKVFKNENRYYIMYLNEQKAINKLSRE